MMLPCHHRESVVNQIKPTIELLTNLDIWYPDILRQHRIEPADYKKGLVFRSAIESIRGSFIASSKTGREGLVGDVLENLKQRASVIDYECSGGSTRYDFTVVLEKEPEIYAALEEGKATALTSPKDLDGLESSSCGVISMVRLRTSPPTEQEPSSAA